MMIVRPSHQHPSPLLNVDSSPEPNDSLSERHVQVTKHPEGPASPSQATKHYITNMEHRLKNCHPTGLTPELRAQCSIFYLLWMMVSSIFPVHFPLTNSIHFSTCLLYQMIHTIFQFII